MGPNEDEEATEQNERKNQLTTFNFSTLSSPEKENDDDNNNSNNNEKNINLAFLFVTSSDMDSISFWHPSNEFPI